ncbi:hypothetical protein GMRT_15780 [Giardia muris]|uniref:Uncharacterized protein n=1 Tax=Giardia muris TaxID=5742 RepID=A0A4Z1STB0_GIAMU|nr:hypothetical protein GMRT_15780 [Giardia muris]|eukprot:TNJ29134.1 hypothetical protein GMRT_15780 [Giardia muris]
MVQRVFEPSFWGITTGEEMAALGYPLRLVEGLRVRLCGLPRGMGPEEIIRTLLQKVKYQGHCNGMPTLELVPPNGNLQCCCRQLYESLLSMASDIQVGGTKVRLLSFSAPREEVRLSTLYNTTSPSPPFTLPTLFSNSSSLGHVLDNVCFSNKRIYQVLHTSTSSKDLNGYIVTGLQAFFPACLSHSTRLLTTMGNKAIEDYRTLLEEVMERLEHLGHCFLICSHATARWFGTIVILTTKNPLDFRHELLRTFPDGEKSLGLYHLSGESLAPYACTLQNCIKRIEEMTHISLDTRAPTFDTTGSSSTSTSCIVLLNALQDQDYRQTERIEQIVAEIWEECERTIEGAIESISVATPPTENMDFVDPESRVDVSFCGLSLRQQVPWEGMLILKVADEKDISKLIEHFHKKLYRKRILLATQTQVSF